MTVRSDVLCPGCRNRQGIDCAAGRRTDAGLRCDRYEDDGSEAVRQKLDQAVIAALQQMRAILASTPG